MFNAQRALTPKLGKPELWFMCYACFLMVVYICVKFSENIMNPIRVMVQIQVHSRNGYVQCSKGNNSKSRQTTHGSCVLHMVLYICVKFHDNTSNGIRVMEWTQN